MKLTTRCLLYFGFILAFSIVLGACGGTDTDDEGMDANTETSNETGTVGERVDENVEGGNKGQEEAKEEPQVGGELVLGQIGNPVEFNPLWAQDTASGDLEILLFRGLYKTDEDLEFQPDIALDMPDISDDGQTWTVEMRDDVQWHDGEDVTAHDVVFTMNIPLHEDYDGPRAGYFDVLESVEAVDEYTVQFNLRAPDATFMQAAGTALVPEHILEDIPVDEMGKHNFSRDPIGNGPFVFDEWKDGEYVRLEAFDAFYEGRPYLDAITVSITGDTNTQVLQLESGDIDMGLVSSEELETVETFDHLQVNQIMAFSYEFLAFNWENPLFQDKEVRHAMAHALDREAMIDAALGGQGEVADIPQNPLNWSYPEEEPPGYEYDPERAKELLAQAGWEEGTDGILERDGKRFAFEILYNEEAGARADIAAIAQAQFRDIGMDVSIQSLEWGAFLERTNHPNHDFDMKVLGWGLGSDPSPKSVFHSDYHEGLNSSLYENEELDELLVANERILDQDERAEMLEEIYTILADDLPYIFLMYPMRNMAVPNELHGFSHHPRLPYYNAHEWWLER